MPRTWIAHPRSRSHRAAARAHWHSGTRRARSSRCPPRPTLIFLFHPVRGGRCCAACCATSRRQLASQHRQQTKSVPPPATHNGIEPSASATRFSTSSTSTPNVPAVLDRHPSFPRAFSLGQVAMSPGRPRGRPRSHRPARRSVRFHRRRGVRDLPLHRSQQRLTTDSHG